MIVTDITKRYNENLPLLKKLALVNVPNLYGLFNSLIADFCKQKYFLAGEQIYVIPSVQITVAWKRHSIRCSIPVCRCWAGREP